MPEAQGIADIDYCTAVSRWLVRHKTVITLSWWKDSKYEVAVSWGRHQGADPMSIYIYAPGTPSQLRTLHLFLCILP